MSSNEGSTDTRKKGGRPAGKIWEYFEKGAQVSRGYYAATCSFCGYYWATAKPLRLKKHIAYNCQKVDSDTKIKVLTLLLIDQEDSDENINSTSMTRRKTSQTDVDEDNENFPTSLDKEIQISKALVKLFVCCNLPFSLIEHPFFQEFMKVLRATYTLPTRWILSNTFLAQEIARIDVKYFVKSHAMCQFLKDAIQVLEIKGGGLKSHTKTRWSTMWDCVNSVARLELAFARVLSIHESEIKSRVKDILTDRSFFENCKIIATILHPLKVSVGCLESRTSTLADCYIHLVSLAEKFNERWNEFTDDTNLLAFFLHPQYRGKGMNQEKFNAICIKAGQIWKDMGHDQASCKRIIDQIRKYKVKRAPFNLSFSNSNNPLVWWETIQDSDELQALALRLFAITPHSASCERSFSILGWFYGQRRTNLALERVEGMCKLHTYYITNAKQELSYYAIDISEDQLHTQIIDSIMEIGDELEEITEADFNIFDEENIVDTEVDQSTLYMLNITEEVELESQIFDIDQEYEDDQSISQRVQAVVLSPQHDDFDIEALVRGIGEL
ncbi:18608_t:CDS:2 [Rhizophagus irregularis]|nr:18608_t:CDS:2 [Rhizophagus irregularis]